MNILKSLGNTTLGLLSLADTNIETLKYISEVGNIRAKSIRNAYSFDEKIREKLRSSKEYQKARMNQILKEELEKVKDISSDTDNEDTDNGLTDDINDMISNLRY